MEAPVQCHHSLGLLLGHWHDGLLAHRAAGCKPPVEVLNAVDVVGSVHREGDTIQALCADNTGEAVGVVRLACGSQYPVQDWLETFTALLKKVQIVSLTQRLAPAPALIVLLGDSSPESGQVKSVLPYLGTSVHCPLYPQSLLLRSRVYYCPAARCRSGHGEMS